MNEGHYRKLFGNLYMRSKDFCMFAWLWISVSITNCSLHPLEPFLQSFCSWAIILFCVICVLIFCAMMDVSNLYIVGRQIMGRYLTGLEVSESFKYVAPCVRNIDIFCGSFTSMWKLFANCSWVELKCFSQ